MYSSPRPAQSDDKPAAGPKSAVSPESPSTGLSSQQATEAPCSNTPAEPASPTASQPVSTARTLPNEPRIRRVLRRYHKEMFPVGAPPLQVALSVFVGVFIGVLPTLGVALPLTWFATTVLKLPKGPAMVSSFVATPPTLFFFFYPLGYFAVGLPLLRPPRIDFDFLSAVGDLGLNNLAEAGGELWSSASEHVVAFMVGMMVVALITAVLCGALAFYVMIRRQQRPLDK